ncbi:hypothetical protein ALC53_04936 [Atta colombica]|uniref:Uncharacterized protein n=1 Tax=Atta colombica TaxID=520822 RepID=A0A195BKH3_9HYME|nr:hypothetical protein ALC53_04936 [Atta colombica]
MSDNIKPYLTTLLWLYKEESLSRNVENIIVETQLTDRNLLNVVRLIFLVHITQSNFAKQQQTSWILAVCATIICRLRHHIGKIYTLAEHVTSNGRFWRCDTQTLRQYSCIIRSSGSVPEQLSIGQFLERLKPLFFSLSLNNKYFLDFKFVLHMSSRMSIFDVLLDHLELFTRLIHHFDVRLQLLIMTIEWILLFVSLVT